MIVVCCPEYHRRCILLNLFYHRVLHMIQFWVTTNQFELPDSNRNHDVVILCMSEVSLRWRHNDHAGVSNHQPHGCLLNRLFRRKSKKTSKLRVTGLCAGNSPGTGEFPAQMASYAENVSIWWRHHVVSCSWLQLGHQCSPMQHLSR